MYEKRMKQINEGKKTFVSMQRALQFIKTGEEAYSCTAGKGLMTVMENGDYVPCRRMPILVGNYKKDALTDLYHKHPVLLDLQKQSIPVGCLGCNHANACRGGLRCLTYAITGSYKNKDTGCNLGL